MVFDDIRRDLKELVELVRRDEQYSAAVMSGKLIPSDEAAALHTQRAWRISELTDQYGLRGPEG